MQWVNWHSFNGYTLDRDRRLQMTQPIQTQWHIIVKELNIVIGHVIEEYMQFIWNFRKAA